MIEIEILTSPGCTGCDKAKKVVRDFVEAKRNIFDGLTWKITDLVEHPELVSKYGIMSTPAVVINGKLEFVGVPKDKKLLERIEQHSKGN